MSALLVKQDPTGESLYAPRAYEAGDVVFSFSDVTWRAERDRYTVEHNSGLHMFDPVLAKTAHSCDPNCRVDLHDMAMKAIRPIAAGDRITFDYHTTESFISSPFDCVCGADTCRRRIE